MLIVASGSSGGTGDLKGDFLAVVAVLISAGYFVFAKTLLTVPLLEFQAGVFAWGGIILIPMVIATDANIIAQSNADLGRIFMVALIPMGGHLLKLFARESPVESDRCFSTHRPCRFYASCLLDIVPVSFSFPRSWYGNSYYYVGY